jgi:dTDP-glucose 4,6-dehydratase
MKTTLVTGGAGFIGSNFILHLLGSRADAAVINLDLLTYAGNLENLRAVENDARYTFVQGSVCDRALLADIFARYSIDCVVNFAAESHVDRSIANPGVFVETNVMGTLTLLEAAKNSWQLPDGNFKPGCLFLQVSTDEVYGALGPTGFFTEETPLDPHSPYSASKAAADLLVKSYWDTYKFPICITRCSNNYGPFQFPEKLIPLMINNTLSHKPLPVYGDGMQIRDWLYVEDHCKAIEMVIENGTLGEVYNIGGHNERHNITIVKTIIGYIKDHVDPKVGEHLIRHVEDRKGHDRRYGIDPKKIKDALGWFPETDFDTGIVRTIRWYLDNKSWMEHVTGGEYLDYYKSMYANR